MNTRKYKRTEYCIVGRLNGHQVWWCTQHAPRAWSRGCGWAVVRSNIDDIKRELKRALFYENVKKIRVAKITTYVTETEEVEYINL